MACKVLSNRGRGCARSSGGVKRFYIREFTDSAPVTDIGSYSVFEMKAGLSEAGVRVEAGSGYEFIHFANIVLNDIVQDDKENIEALVMNAYLQVVAEQMDGKFMLLGERIGLSSLSSDGYSTGVSKSDSKMYTIVLEKGEPENVEFITLA